MNPVLVRQLKRLGASADSLPDATTWRALLDRVSAAYDQADEDRYTLERAMAVSSEELREAMQGALAASRAKSLFLANVSHEIRTPMTAIVGYTDMLADPEFPSRAEAIEGIRRNADHLLGVINDILDLSRIEDGKMTVENRPFSPWQIVRESVELLRPKAEEKRLAVVVETDGTTPERVMADPLRLKQIVINLVGNAIKFTQHGRVRVALGLERAPTPRLMITVEDTGIGMAADQVDRLFTLFVQADESMARRFGGSGLGLSISRALARLMGGDITIRSSLGEGSVFTLSIPLGQAEEADPGTPAGAEDAEPADRAPLAGRRILLVEDGPDNQRIIEHHLRRAGAEVAVASNGQVALGIVASAAHAFDLILMDMQMPVMDGYTATGVLRSRGLRTPIIALTAHAMEGERQRCLDAGCDGYLTKPITRDDLVSAVTAFISEGTPERRAA
ncbi:MAG TPA: ATP-binding protein [Phycisphaerales bacterium]|nr:ATP-binding protein [Phycisphaerales bacterium]